MITSCTKCGSGFDAQSEESANEPERYCEKCWTQLFIDGGHANDNNLGVLKGLRRGERINNPHPLGTQAHKRWDAGYWHRDMVNDG